MIVIWDKKTKKILHQTSDESLLPNYLLLAQQDPNTYGFFFNNSAEVFPESGKIIDSETGEYREMTYNEKVISKLASPLLPTQKLVVTDGVETPISKTREELLKAGLATLNDYKSQKKSSLYFEATAYLNTSLTPTNKYTTSDAAQKIAIATISMTNLGDNDPNKVLLTQQGLLYTIDKAKEILAFCAAVTASFRAACNAVDSAINLAQIDDIHLSTYL
jgi:hypothetical protein